MYHFVSSRICYQSLLTVIILTGIYLSIYIYSCYEVVISLAGNRAMIRVVKLGSMPNAQTFTYTYSMYFLHAWPISMPI